MPIYAFACSACGHDFERLQRLSDADPTTCPACGAEGTIGRQLTAPQFRLAGGGWYETDFKKDGDKKRNLAGDGAAAAPAAAESKPTASGDSKPAAKTEAAPAAKPGPQASAS
jgi:putative FmdB family regulatory protein